MLRSLFTLSVAGVYGGSKHQFFAPLKEFDYSVLRAFRDQLWLPPRCTLMFLFRDSSGAPFHYSADPIASVGVPTQKFDQVSTLCDADIRVLNIPAPLEGDRHRLASI